MVTNKMKNIDIASAFNRNILQLKSKLIVKLE